MNQDQPDQREGGQSPACAGEVDQLCDAFEQQWKAGDRPEIDAYLQRVDSAFRAELLRELVALEIAYRRRAGEEVQLAEYQRRFPEYAGPLQDAWQLLLSWGDHKPGNPHAVSSCANTDVPCQSQPDTVGPAVSPTVPTQVGRYQIQEVLGTGGFGMVYRALDPQLQRPVALKVPHSSLLRATATRETYLHEARAAAQLKHPGLVAVYDVQQEGDSIYIVQEYVDGQDLGCWAASVQPDPSRLVRLLVEIVEAVGYAHQQGLVHRDLKPGNILVDGLGHAHVADFGLALNENLQPLRRGETCGTPPYMAPEQVRGETHRLDGRADLWSLGVILYEVLTGRRPFVGDSSAALFDEIQHRDPKPPRMIRPEVPAELERIVLKCLAKRATVRYGSATELVEDLRAWLADSERPIPVELAGSVAVRADTPVTHQAMRSIADSERATRAGTPDASVVPVRIVPKGLRSFEAQDADFFLDLLPGPRDREGLPESIRFWKTRIEETDADATFLVGVLYGPSGCGKSSLVKAGLLPRLSPRVLPILIEATPGDTELRLLKGLRKHVPWLATNAGLTEALAQLRARRVGEHSKVLLVLDQFEQWLHATADLGNSPLVRALRQCDGQNVQCVILVRDDFWMSTTRFMQALEIPQVENQNSAAVDLFDRVHARKVLQAFGLAYGRLPEKDLSADQQRFLDRAVQDLAQDGKVICVQLSLFADMMKGRPWTPASLQEVGGTSGVGVAFLDETFTAKTAPPTHRLHARAAQAVLKALLPEVGTDIKGQMQPAARLLDCSGYTARPDDFRDLLQILNRELRLITPTEPEAAVQVAECGPPDPGGSSSSVAQIPPEPAGPLSDVSPLADRGYFQLTHDYLVPSLRDWLTRKQKETRRGRAELRLADQAALWNAKPERRHLPSFLEFARIRMLTKSQDWTPTQQKMMRAATRHYGAIGTGVLALLLVAGIVIQQFLVLQRRKSVDDALVTLQSAHGPAVPLMIDNLRRLPRSLVKQKLDTLYQSVGDVRKLPVAYAVADPDFGHVDRAFLIRAIANAPAEECDNIVVALSHDRQTAVQDLQSAAATATSNQNWTLKTRLATVALYLNDPSIASEMLQAEPATPPTLSEPDWHDPPLDPSWPAVAGATLAAIEAAHGLVAERFAFCLDMPWDTFVPVQEALRASRYRPTRVRPFMQGDRRLVSAIWTRDGGDWRWERDLTADQLPPPDAAAVKDGLVPADVAAYAGESATVLYSLVWAPPTEDGEQRRVCVGMTKEEVEAVSKQVDQAGLRAKTLHAFVAADGIRRYAWVWSDHGEPVQVDPSSRRDRSYSMNHREDVSVAGAGIADEQLAASIVLYDPMNFQRDQLYFAQHMPDVMNTSEGRLTRGKAQYYLDRPQDALRDLDVLVAETSPPAEARLYWALCQAQLGQGEKALKAAARLFESRTESSRAAMVQILIHAWLGEMDEAKRGLDELVRQHECDAVALYGAASVAAQLARIRRDKGPSEVDGWKQLSLQLLRQCCALEFDAMRGIEQDPDFAPLHNDEGFRLLAGCLRVAGNVYATVYQDKWRQDVLESVCDWDRTPDEHQHAASDYVADGFRPVAVAAYGLPDNSTVRTTSVWHRPRSPFPRWDPVQRTAFIDHFPAWPGQTEKLADVVRPCDDASLRSGMCLAIGSMKEPSKEATEKKWPELWTQWHVHQPDGGTHSATGWALGSWNAPLPEVPSERCDRTDRDWVVTTTGLTLVRIPAGEVEGATNLSGRRRGKRIRVREEFWLSDREVTSGQFLQFLNDDSADEPFEEKLTVYGGQWDRTHLRLNCSGDPSLPASGVNWFEAVMFCNWLSRREGCEPCYKREGKEQIWDPNDRTNVFDAWRLIPGASGYRLPTADEWEYACRARTTTAFCSGEAAESLEHYAWCLENSKYDSASERCPHSVCTKLCNGWGLFDMHGNVQEWCQDWGIEGRGFYRVLRGGHWVNNAVYCGSAMEGGSEPYQTLNFFYGFRVAIGPMSPGRAAAHN